MNITDKRKSGKNRALFREWIGELKLIGGDIIELSSSTEGEFLEIGLKLQGYSVTADEISRLAMSVSQMMTTGALVKVIEDLKKVLNLLFQYVEINDEEATEKSSGLDQIKSILSDIRYSLDDFRKTIKVLLMLGVSSRIESARLVGSDGGFKVLAEEIKGLAGRIEKSISQIDDQSKSLGYLIEKTIHRIVDLEYEQKREIKAMLIDARAGLLSLEELHIRSSAAAVKISESSSAISRNISEVVMSMQFHDITRQQMEHVKTALDDLTVKLAGALEDEELDEEAETELIKLSGDICELQKAQIHHSVKSFTQATLAIRNNLKFVSSNVTEMFMEVRKLVGETSRSGSMSIVDIESGFVDVSTSLIDNTKRFHESSGVIDAAIEKIKNMTLFVKDIRKSSSDVELIALNSRIKAAHTGSKGQSLGVLAAAIQKLSVDSKNQSNRISTALVGISTYAIEAYNEVRDEIVGRNGQVTEIIDNLKSMFRTLNELNSKIMECISGINNQGRSLIDRIELATSSINVHNRFLHAGSMVMDRIESLIGQTRRIHCIPGLSHKGRKERLESLKELYTMQSERLVHYNALGFGNYEGQAEDNESVDSEFGDNVELF